jgi:hypothetical protein
LFTSRRFLLKASLASLGLSALAGPAAAMGNWSSVLNAARAGLERAGGRVAHRDIVGVADFARPSSEPRLHLVDMASGKVDSLLVAHGRGSDPYKTGWLSLFSNQPRSDATSRGDFLTGDYYTGAHGRSMRVIGLDSSNDNAESRGIVVHSAWYVGPSVVETEGMLGRSEGCFAVSADDLPRVLERLGPGRLLVSTKLSGAPTSIDDILGQ